MSNLPFAVNSASIESFAVAAARHFKIETARSFEIVDLITEFHRMKRQMCGRFHTKQQERRCRKECVQHVKDSLGITMFTPLLWIRLIGLIVNLVRLYREWVMSSPAAYAAAMNRKTPE